MIKPRCFRYTPRMASLWNSLSGTLSRTLSGTIAVPFRHASRLLRQLRPDAGAAGQRLNEAVGALFMAVVQADPFQTAEEAVFIEELFSASFGQREGRRVREALQAQLSGGRGAGEQGGAGGEGRIDIPAQCRQLAVLGREERVELVRGMIEVGYADGQISEAEMGAICTAAAAFDLDAGVVEQCMADVQAERDRRSDIVRSGAGIVAALVVIAIFVFAATFLRSVMFGLMLAYFFLPIQHWYQHRVYGHPRVMAWFSAAPTPAEERERRITRSCNATMITIALLCLLGGAALYGVSRTFFSRDHAPGDAGIAAGAAAGILSGASFADTGEADADAAISALAIPPPRVAWLEQWRPDLDKSPLLRHARQTAIQYLTEPAKQEELAHLALKNVQTIIVRAGGLVAGLMHVLLDMMLTAFFFSFFLKKIAAGQSDELGRRKPTGQYIVEAIFESGWLPDMHSRTLREAQLIIDDILGMLRVWVRGYLWIILIESSLYTGIFMFLRVPWFALAGVIAGSTILLPFIGPIVGCGLTVLVTLAVNPEAITPAVGVIVTYTLIHGVLEQLFLYPSLVGEALGLNTLETIIVVLLGGIVAGLAGVIFAVPVAAILKRMIPKIYAALRAKRDAG